MLTDQQVETYILSFKSQLQALNTQQTSQNASLNQIQTTLNNLQNTVNNLPTSTSGGSGLDTYLADGKVIHRIATLFQAAVTFASNVLVQGVLSLTNALTVANGGTSSATLTAHAVLLGEGTSALGTATIGTSGYVLTDNGAAADPTFQAIPSQRISAQNVVTGSRAFATVYHNTTGKPLYVGLFASSSVGTDQIAALSDASNPPTTYVAAETTSATAVTNTNLFFIVLPGNYYEIKASYGTGTVNGWIEWE